MSYSLTPWGYEIDGALPPLIDETAFNTITGGKWASDSRLSAAIAAASAAIRNACGWHVYPNAACRATIDCDGSRSFWLATTCLTSVDEVELLGNQTTNLQWSRIGQVLINGGSPIGLQSAIVDYHAGYSTLPADLSQLVADVVVRGIALSYGVTQEVAGDVSISYSGSIVSAASTSLVEADMFKLSTYRAVRAHAV